MEDVRKEILNLSKNGRGYFGEFLFENIAKSKSEKLERAHFNTTDFIMDGVSIDVKTTYKYIKKDWNPDILHTGTTVMPGITRVSVIFYNDRIVANFDHKLVGRLPWKEVDRLYSIWVASREKPVTKAKKNPNGNKLWNKLEIGICHSQYFIDSGKVEKRDNGDWHWLISGEEKYKFIQESCKYVKEKLGYAISPAMTLWGRKQSTLLWSNQLEDELKGTWRQDINNLMGLAKSVAMGLVSDEKVLNTATLLIGRPIKDPQSILNAIRAYYDPKNLNEKGTRSKYPTKEIYDLCK
jgi:hypothetical protein